MIPLITFKLNPHNTEYSQTIQVKVADSVFSSKKYFLRRLSSGEPLMRLYVTQGASDRIMARHAQRQIAARFCVMNLRNSGQVSRAIYTLSRIIFHHNLFVPDSIRVSLIHHHQTPDSMTSLHYFPESTSRIGFSCSLLISHLSLMHLRSAHRSWTEKVIVHRNYQEGNLISRMVRGEV